MRDHILHIEFWETIYAIFSICFVSITLLMLSNCYLLLNQKYYV